MKELLLKYKDCLFWAQREIGKLGLVSGIPDQSQLLQESLTEVQIRRALLYNSDWAIKGYLHSKKELGYEGCGIKARELCSLCDLNNSGGSKFVSVGELQWQSEGVWAFDSMQYAIDLVSYLV